MQQEKEDPRIVILGGGFGGSYCAQALARVLRGSRAQITLLDSNNYFVFYPFLVEAGTGSLEPRHAVISIRAFLKGVQFRMAEVVALDPDRRTVTYRLPGGDAGGEPDSQSSGEAGDESNREPRSEAGARSSGGSSRASCTTIAYDHLVISLGSVTRLPDVPGLREFGFGLKNLADAVDLRDRAIRMLELADSTSDPERRRAMLHFVVVGGNFSGVEVAGEFHVFLRQASRAYANLRPDDCSVTLVEIADRILPGLDDDLSHYAITKMRRRKITVRLGRSVKRIERERVTLDNGEVLPTHTTIWCAGIAPAPRLADLPLPKDRLGYLLCDRDLRVQGHENVWALGDCAVNPDRNGKPYPATAQHATRQGKHLAVNLKRVIQGLPPAPFDHESQGSLVGLGCRTGVAKVFGIKLSGFAAWFLWRTVYLLKLPGWSRRIRVALDWTMDLLFGRDYVQLGLRGRREHDVPITPRPEANGPPGDPPARSGRLPHEPEGLGIQ